jgi:hypothetical protein
MNMRTRLFLYGMGRKEINYSNSSLSLEILFESCFLLSFSLLRSGDVMIDDDRSLHE